MPELGRFAALQHWTIAREAGTLQPEFHLDAE